MTQIIIQKMNKFKIVERLAIVGVLCLFVTCKCLGVDFYSTNTSPVFRPILLDEFLSTYGINGSNVVYTMRSSSQKTALDGPFEVFSAGGAKIAQGSFHDDKLQGELFLWHPNGKLSAQQHFENGNLTGIETYWDTNSVKLRTTEWEDGNKNGLEIYWAKDGKMSQKIEWKLGRPISIEFFQEGVLQRQLTGTNVIEFFRKKVTP